jgi:hypothetical protein
MNFDALIFDFAFRRDSDATINERAYYRHHQLAYYRQRHHGLVLLPYRRHLCANDGILMSIPAPTGTRLAYATPPFRKLTLRAVIAIFWRLIFLFLLSAAFRY